MEGEGGGLMCVLDRGDKISGKVWFFGEVHVFASGQFQTFEGFLLQLVVGVSYAHPPLFLNILYQRSTHQIILNKTIFDL